VHFGFPNPGSKAADLARHTFAKTVRFFARLLWKEALIEFDAHLGREISPNRERLRIHETPAGTLKALSCFWKKIAIHEETMLSIRGK
jgi:hypothetical protein